MAGANNFPKLHNAMWPGLVGKGSRCEPPIDLDTMLDLTAKAEVNGVKFDGVDIFLRPPTPISISPMMNSSGWPKRCRPAGWSSARSWPPSGHRPAAARPWAPRPTANNLWRMCAKSCRLGRNCATWACGITASSASTWPRAPGFCQGSQGQSPRKWPRPSARPATWRPTLASGWRPRAKSAGAACTPGRP